MASPDDNSCSGLVPPLDTNLVPHLVRSAGLGSTPVVISCLRSLFSDDGQQDRWSTVHPQHLNSFPTTFLKPTQPSTVPFAGVPPIVLLTIAVFYAGSPHIVPPNSTLTHHSHTTRAAISSITRSNFQRRLDSLTDSHPRPLPPPGKFADCNPERVCSPCLG